MRNNTSKAKAAAWVFAFSLLVVLGACTCPKREIPKNTISPYLFGQNLWLTEGAEGRPGYINKSLWPMVEESGVKIIRIGGNGYDQVLPSFDTLEHWVKSIKAIGAEPILQVSKYETAEKAASVVHFMNVENNFGVKFWAIGNEPYLIHKFSIDSISNYIKKYASAMKAVDPSIKIFVPDAAAYAPELYEALLVDNRTSIAGRDSNGNWYVDGVTFHTYPNDDKYNRSDVLFWSVNKVKGMMVELTDLIKKSNEIHDRFNNDALIWGLTEFNITYRNPSDLSNEGIAVPSFVNGQFWAEVYGLAMEYGAFCVTPWCIQESDRASTYFGYIGAPPDFIPHSTYYHTQLLSDYMQGGYVRMYSENPYIKAFASVSNKQTSIVLLNQSSTEKKRFAIGETNNDDIELKLQSDLNLGIRYEGEIDAKSTRVIIFSPKGKCLKRVIYSEEMARRNEKPKVESMK